MDNYEIQGRRMELDDSRRVVRNEVRLTSAQGRELAYDAAARMVADGLTAWVFRIDREAGRKTYQLLDRMP